MKCTDIHRMSDLKQQKQNINNQNKIQRTMGTARIEFPTKTFRGCKWTEIPKPDQSFQTKCYRHSTVGRCVILFFSPKQISSSACSNDHTLLYYSFDVGGVEARDVALDNLLPQQPKSYFNFTSYDPPKTQLTIAASSPRKERR